MWPIVEEITGVPRHFLLGIAELYTAGVAQRMSWAAQRDTKRKEDLAYCLLCIFGVTMPMIYGEGGDQAFFRLQEHIMKISRDDSILAWGLGVTHLPINNNSGQVTTGRILAAAPSDFANSRRIVPREQSTTFLSPLDISGGSLRIHLPLLTTSTNEVFGLLRCGPEHDTQQVVGIPLAKVSSGSSDDTLPRLIHIRNANQSEESVDTSQQYWLYDDNEFSTLNLELIDVAPRSCWHENRPWLHRQWYSPIVILIILCSGYAITRQGTSTEVQYCIIILSRTTPLEELARNLEFVMQEASGKRSASNGRLHIHITLESNDRQPIFTIRLEKLPHSPSVTINATTELQKSDLKLALTQVLKEGWQQDAERRNLDEEAKDQTSQLARVRREREMLEGEIRKLEQKRKTLLEEEDNRAQRVFSLIKRQVKVKDEQEHTSEQWRHALKRWDEFWQSEVSDESETKDNWALLRWAASNGCVELVELLLSQDAGVAATNQDGWTPLIFAAANGFQAVAQMLLDTWKVDVNWEDNNGRTSLSWASERGHETLVQLLLQNGADVKIADKHTRTAISYATKYVIVQLFLASREWQLRHSFQCSGIVRGAIFSANSKLLALSTNESMQLCDTETGILLQIYSRKRSVYSDLITFSPNSKLLAFVKPRQTIELRDTTTGRLQQTRKYHRGITQIDFSPDSELLTVQLDYESIHFWNTRTEQVYRIFQNDRSEFQLFIVSPNSKLFATQPDIRTVQLWDIATKQLQETFTTDSTRAVDFEIGEFRLIRNYSQ
ncbi:hypothetical protein E0Z10_g1502 [Xylaria hypoxylon]|uniref:Uncharacterized protein n=1 Tax=Xylaria hypoxylon TaxID=37992 RepID=A0A4Z0Z6L1_9PEZI|nr:hypothetical protein E0Z10_g1502 [Xylaria hypoxylon]